MYSLYVTVNMLSGEEREFEVEPTFMDQGALEDAIIAVLDGNTDATSFIFTVSKQAETHT